MNVHNMRYLLFILVFLSSSIGIYAQTSHFAFTSNTGDDMTAIVPSIINPTFDGAVLSNGDEIGVFTPGGLCVGATVWNGSNMSIAVHVDNNLTTIVDGIAVAEQLLFRVWDASLSKEGAATIAYSVGGPNYSNGGIAVLSSLAAVTGTSSYKVTYDGNSSTSGTVPAVAVSYLQGSTVTVLDNARGLVRNGYTFSGWNTAADSSGTNYAAGVTLTIGTDNVVLYAKWRVLPTTYTITYSGNGSTSGTPPTDQVKQYNIPLTLADNSGSLSRTGYIFAGWNTAADGNGTSYTAGTNYTSNANLTLFAKWTLDLTYTITYDGNGNTTGTPPTNQVKQHDVLLTLAANSGNLSRTGFIFAGWNTTADGSGTSYTTGTSYTSNANLTLFAKWIVNPSYSVIYNGNGSTGGTVPVDGTTYLQNETVTVLGNTGNLTKEGYLFSGWNTAADGSGTTYAAGATFPMGTTNVVLYAKWTLKTFFLTINKEIVRNSPEKVKDTTVAYKDTVRLDAPSITGFSFVYWRVTEGTALLIDSTKSICKVILQNVNASISAVYDGITNTLTMPGKIPTSFGLNYNDKIKKISFAIPSIQGHSNNIHVNIRIFDIKGRLLGTIIDKKLAPGNYTANMNLFTKMSNATLICRMETTGFLTSIKIVHQ